MPAYSKEIEKWYHRAHWKNLRKLVLSRDPVCRVCQRNAATIADHIIPHKGQWALFTDMANLQGICKPCHDKKTATENGGFGNLSKPNAGPSAQPTGTAGRQFISSSIRVQKLDAALDFDVAELLAGIPE